MNVAVRRVLYHLITSVLLQALTLQIEGVYYCLLYSARYFTDCIHGGNNYEILNFRCYLQVLCGRSTCVFVVQIVSNYVFMHVNLKLF
jgi:hypothetical protein